MRFVACVDLDDLASPQGNPHAKLPLNYDFRSDAIPTQHTISLVAAS
ncbi:MAG TPA: hypothetical protein VHX39_13235 [Acetobacteraceae bacterium]|nr:hypothetical protein [Acetobacteraceae bacterium]